MKNKFWKVVRVNLHGPDVDIDDFEDNLVVEGIAFEKATTLVQKHNEIINEIKEKDRYEREEWGSKWNT